MVGLIHEQELYMLMKKMVKANIKSQNYQTSVKNVTVMSAKIAFSDIIPVVNRKEIDYKIYLHERSFFWFIFCF